MWDACSAENLGLIEAERFGDEYQTALGPVPLRIGDKIGVAERKQGPETKESPNSSGTIDAISRPVGKARVVCFLQGTSFAYAPAKLVWY